MHVVQWHPQTRYQASVKLTTAPRGRRANEGNVDDARETLII